MTFVFLGIIVCFPLILSLVMQQLEPVRPFHYLFFHFPSSLPSEAFIAHGCDKIRIDLKS